jgi:hypothetical protein
MSSQLPQTPDVDLRPWRSQVRALLGDVTKDDDTIAALVNAFETHGLTLGSTTRRAPTDHLGRFRKPELIAALTTFDQSLRDKVIAVLQKVGGIAPQTNQAPLHRTKGPGQRGPGRSQIMSSQTLFGPNARRVSNENRSAWD